jgi:hypothetical protein
MTLEELFALITGEFGRYTSSPFAQDSLIECGAYWVMDLGSYKEIRAACKEAGAVYPPGEENPEDWVPAPGDLLYGLPVEVHENGGRPHLEFPRRR